MKSHTLPILNANPATQYLCLKAGHCDGKYNSGFDKHRCIADRTGYVGCPYNKISKSGEEQ